MRIFNLKYSLIILIALTISLANCTKENTLPLNEELVFPSSYQITIWSYEYLDPAGNVFKVQSDTNYTLLADTLNDSPVLAWDSIPLKYVSVALFTNPPVVQGGEIRNSEDIVWQWHSGMEFANYGRVQYFEGRNVINEIIDYENSPVPLNEGHYYWAVWAWGNAGVRVLFSSKQREIYVLK